jgi:hypothetical protein
MGPRRYECKSRPRWQRARLAFDPKTPLQNALAQPKSTDEPTCIVPVDRPDRVDGGTRYGLDSAICTQHIHAGNDMNFARNESRGDDRAFAVGDPWAIIDGGDHGETEDVQLGQIQRQESPCADTVGQDPCSRSDQLCIDDAAIAPLDGDRKLSPGGLLGLRLRGMAHRGTETQRNPNRRIPSVALCESSDIAGFCQSATSADKPSCWAGLAAIVYCTLSNTQSIRRFVSG